MRPLIYSLSLCLFAAAAVITAAALALPDRTSPKAGAPAPQEAALPPQAVAPSGEVREMLRRIADEQAASNALVGDLRREIGLLQEETALRELTASLEEDEGMASLEEENRRLLAELQGAFEALREERAAAEGKEAAARLAEEQASHAALDELRRTVAELKDELAAERTRGEVPAREDSGAQAPSVITGDSSQAGAQPAVTAASKMDGTVIVILGGGLFRPGQDILSPALEEAVQRALPAIVTSPESSIVVEGHTDSTPLGATLSRQFADNKALSLMRAEAVAGLLAKAGVDRGRIRSIGYGGSRPIAPNDSAAGRGENRRVEIRIVPPEKAPEKGDGE